MALGHGRSIREGGKGNGGYRAWGNYHSSDVTVKATERYRDSLMGYRGF